MQLGFIGLGAMGRAMATNLLKAGHQVRVWNRSQASTRDLAGVGAQVCGAMSEVFETGVVISMLADDAALRHVILASGVLGRAPRNALHINMATISVAFAKELAQAHADHGLRYIAAPVFGRPDVAQAAKLNILAAGATPDIEQVRPLFDVMGQKTWLVGDEPYRANALKLAGNFMLGCAIEAMAEACALTEAHGLSSSETLQMLTNTLFSAPVYKNYGALITERRYEPAMFKLSLALKDIRLALAAGEDGGVPMPFASVLRDNLIEAVAQGDGAKDFAALARVTSRRAKLPGP